MEKIIQSVLELIVLALAGSAISMTLTKAVITKKFRDYIKSKSDFWGELFSCPYCMSHWVNAVVLVLSQPIILTLFPEKIIPGIEYVVIWFALVSLSAFGSGFIYKSLSSME
jgi:hypothetical protein